MHDMSTKEQMIRKFMADQELDALLLRKVSSFAWATDGAKNYVNPGADNGEGFLLFTPDGRYVITNNIEAPRFKLEERLEEKGYKFPEKKWYGDEDPVSELTRGMKLGVDGCYPGAVDISGPLSKVRAVLTPEECQKFSEVGSLCARAMDKIVSQIEPGMTDYQISAILGKEMEFADVFPMVKQVAVDDRSLSIRHAITVGRTMDKYAVIALCGRKYGLVASMTRSIHFGSISEELAEKHRQTASVDAALIAATRPEAMLKDVFARAQEAYADAGYPDEWRHHHQGGTAGYEPREFLGSPTATDLVEVGQAYAWNPTIAGKHIAGAKSEDTILVGSESNEIITTTQSWPMLDIQVGGQTVRRAGILEL